MANIKAQILSFIPGNLKNRLFWAWQRRLWLAAHPQARIRNEEELRIAEDFFFGFHGLDKKIQQERLSLLESGLDADSQQLIRLVLARQHHIFTHNFLEQYQLFSAQERDWQAVYYREIGQLKRFFARHDFPAFSPESFVFWGGLRFLPETAQVRLEGSIFIDGGAYNGDSAVAICRQYHPKAVYSFEPQPDNYRRLVNNTKEEGAIRALSVGLGDGQEKADTISAAGGSSRLGLGDDKIPLVSLDAFVRQEKIETIGCIKLDLEGYEQKALAGMEDILRKYKPVLAVSIYHSNDDFFNIKPWLEKIVPEYRFQVVKANPFALAQEVMLMAYIP